MKLQALVLPICLLCLVSCEVTQYMATSDQYKFNPSLENKIILIQEKDVPNATTVSLQLNRKMWTAVDKSVSQMVDPDARDFVLATKLMMQKQFIAAYQTINHVQSPKFACQVKIIKADCLYELKSDTVDFRVRYQQAYDCSSDPRIKFIAETRYRFVKYAM